MSLIEIADVCIEATSSFHFNFFSRARRKRADDFIGLAGVGGVDMSEVW